MATPDPNIQLATREELLADRDKYLDGLRKLYKRNDEQKLWQQIDVRLGKLQRYTIKSLTEMIEIGRRLDALRHCAEYGNYMRGIEERGIGRTTAANYRRLAAHATRLRAQPNAELMSLNAAKELVAGWDATARNSDDLDVDNAPEPKGKPKGLTLRQPSRRTLERMASRLIQFARDSRYSEPDLVDQLEHVIVRIQHVTEQLKRAQESPQAALDVEQEQDDQTDEEVRPS